MPRFTVWLQQIDRALPAGTHQLLAQHVRFLIQHQPIHYERRLILCNRQRLTAITKDQGSILNIMEAFVQSTADSITYSPVPVHRTLLIFLRDWFLASNLQTLALQYHQQQHNQNPQLQQCMSLPGWDSMNIDRKLLLVLMVCYDDTTYRDGEEYVYLLQTRFRPFWVTMHISDFYKSCNALREVVITKHNEYIHLFQHLDWNGMKQELRMELNAAQPPAGAT